MRRPRVGSVDLTDLVPVGAFFVLFGIVDRLTGALAGLTADDVQRWSLAIAAVQRRAVWWIGLLAVAALAATSADIRRRATGRWSELEHGTALRLLAAPMILFLAWQGSLQPFNVYADQLHLLDRGLVVALAAASLWRPVLLVPFALQFRLVSTHTEFPLHTTAWHNISELPVIVLLLIAAGHLLFVLTGRRATSVVVLGIGAALASHFFVPGKGKLLLGWLTANDVANLPLAAYTTGWLGHTDGSMAADVASVFDRFGPFVKVATLVLELGAVLAVARRQLLQPWLVGAIAFHVVTFLTTGFFFVGWILAEVGLLIILSRRDLRAWVDENATWPRAAVAVVAVLAAPVVFHPPGLAWLDAPVSYGYRLEAVGESGTTYELPASTFAPLDHEILFKRLQFDGPGHLSGAYGALASAERLDELNGIGSLADLVALEAAQPEPDPSIRAASLELLSGFVEATGDDEVRSATRWLHRFRPPSSFWSSWSDDDYRFEEPLERLDVILLTRVHDPVRRGNGIILTRTDPVLTLTRQPDGSVEAESFRH